MDSQWNSLIQSYHSNFVQYKITGNPSYEKAYTAAQDGLTSMLNQLLRDTESQKDSITNFYKSGAEQNIIEKQQLKRKLEGGIIMQKDEIEAAKIRSQPESIPLPTPPISTTQYVILGVTGAIALALFVL
jgi:hypothetical protein